MANSNSTEPPGSWLERLVFWLWYSIFVMLFQIGIPYSVLTEFFHKIKKVDYSALPKRTHDTVVLTGGTRGIGEYVLKKLLQLDFTVIMGARKPDAGLKLVNRLRQSGVTSGKVKCFPLNLKSLKSVQEFARNTLNATDRIDLVINNAGVMYEPYETTEDGFESQFQVNYLSHFLLTNLLLPRLKATGTRRSTKCRIVNVSSLAHFGSDARYLTDCHKPKVYSSYKAYYDSKFCQIVSTKYLNTLLNAERANASVFSVHPGIIATDLYDSMGWQGKVLKSLFAYVRSADQGAEEIMRVAISPELEAEGGCYLQNSKPTRALKDAENKEVQKALWELSKDCITKVVLKAE